MRAPPACLGGAGLQAVLHLSSRESEGLRVHCLPGLGGGGDGGELRKLRCGTQEFSEKNLSELAARREDSREYRTEKRQPSMCLWRLPKKEQMTLEIKKCSHTPQTPHKRHQKRITKCKLPAEESTFAAARTGEQTFLTL